MTSIASPCYKFHPPALHLAIAVVQTDRIHTSTEKGHKITPLASGHNSCRYFPTSISFVPLLSYHFKSYRLPRRLSGRGIRAVVIHGYQSIRFSVMSSLTASRGGDLFQLSQKARVRLLQSFTGFSKQHRLCCVHHLRWWGPSPGRSGRRLGGGGTGTQSGRRWSPEGPSTRSR